MNVQRSPEHDGERFEGSRAFEVDGDFSTDALPAILERTTGKRVSLAAVGNLIWVGDPNVTQDEIQAALQDDDTSAEPAVTPMEGSEINPDLATLAAKPSGEDFSADEIQQALRALLKPYKQEA